MKWTVDIPAPPVAAAAPVSDDEHVYIALRTGQIVARSNVDGSEAWQRDLATERPLAEDGGLVFAVGSDAVHALRGKDGALAWEAPVVGVTAPPLAHGGWVIVLAAGKVVALRANDGTIIWQRAIGAAIARPAIDGDRLFISTRDSRVVAMEVTSGNVLWEQRLPGEPTEPFGWYGYVYVGAADRQFYCLKAKDGEIDWRWRVGAGVNEHAAADDSRVYFVGQDNVLRALDRVTGVQQWQSGLKRRAAAGPVVMRDWVLLPSSTSPEIWAWTVDGKAAGIIATPAEPVAEPEFVLPSGDGAKVYVITGGLARVWQLTLIGTAADLVPVALEEMPGILSMMPGTPVNLELPPR